MLRRLACLLLIFALVFTSLAPNLAHNTYAQNGSPVPVDPIPTDVPHPTETTQPPSSAPQTDPVAPADSEGNTPLGPHTNPPLFPLPRTDVYLYILQVTVAGQTEVIDGTDGNGPFAAPGYHSDNVKVITIKTTAAFDGNLNVCVIFDGSSYFNPSAIELLYFVDGSWLAITNSLNSNTVCGYSPAVGTFAVAEPDTTPPSSPTSTSSPTNSPSPTSTATSTPSATATLTPTPTTTETATSAPSRTQFALSNVYVTFDQIPTSGTTQGAILSPSNVPALPGAYLTGNAWYFSVDSSVIQSGNKILCVVFETAPYADPHQLVLLKSNGSTWSPLSGLTLDSLLDEQGTLCGYISSFGNFALVERAPATATATASPSRTPPPTATQSASPSPSPTPTATATATGSPSVTSTSTVTAFPSQTASSTATSTPSRTSTPTATLPPGSYPIGTVLRATAGVNLRSNAGSGAPSRGVIASGTTVTVTGPSVASGGLTWVPVTSPLGAGWIAGRYLAPVPTATPTRTPAQPTTTRTPAPPTSTRTPGGSTATRTPSRTPTRPPGGFIAGDAVRTTANVNLRSAPGTSSTILRVVPSSTAGTITGPGVVSGGNTFYPIAVSGYPSGYVAASYLQRITATATRTRTPTATVVGVRVRYTTDIVNLRRGPGTSYGIAATLPKGTRVNITGTPTRVSGADWYPVIVNGVGSGWISGSFLTASPPL